MKFSEAIEDDSDEDKNPNLAGKTPRTKKRIIRETESEKIKKLGPFSTGFTLFKGFVCTGILYMPLNFQSGGSLFSAFALIFALVLTLYCIKLVLECREALGGNMSFSEMGTATYGKWGKLMVDVSLFSS
jgi:amino acid permease